MSESEKVEKKSSSWKVFVVVALIAASLMFQVFIIRDMASTASHTAERIIGLNGTPVR